MLQKRLYQLDMLMRFVWHINHTGIVVAGLLIPLYQASEQSSTHGIDFAIHQSLYVRANIISLAASSVLLGATHCLGFEQLEPRKVSQNFDDIDGLPSNCSNLIGDWSFIAVAVAYFSDETEIAAYAFALASLLCMLPKIIFTEKRERFTTSNLNKAKIPRSIYYHVTLSISFFFTSLSALTIVLSKEYKVNKVSLASLALAAFVSLYPTYWSLSALYKGSRHKSGSPLLPEKQRTNRKRGRANDSTKSLGLCSVGNQRDGGDGSSRYSLDPDWENNEVGLSAY